MTSKTPEPTLLRVDILNTQRISTPENPQYVLGRPPLSARPIDSEEIIVRSDGAQVLRRVIGNVIVEKVLDGPQSAVKEPMMKYPHGQTAPQFTKHIINGVDTKEQS